jgi:hypothetical protein
MGRSGSNDGGRETLAGRLGGRDGRSIADRMVAHGGSEGLQRLRTMYDIRADSALMVE